MITIVSVRYPENRRRGYDYNLSISDKDYEHGHGPDGHVFPCTKRQLQALCQAIEDVLETNI